MNKRKVFLIPDTGEKIGFGHFFRLFALAQKLQEDFKIHFILNEGNAFLESQLKNERFNFIVDKIEDFSKKLTKEIVILDGYKFSIEFHKTLKSGGNKVVQIDDFHHQSYYVDLIVNHAINVNPADYRIPLFTCLKIGPEYRLLRPEFENSFDRNPVEKLSRLFISFGGSDNQNLTELLTRSAVESGRFDQINVLISNNYKHESVLHRIKEENKTVSVHKNLNAADLRKLICSCEIACVPASTLSYECVQCRTGIVLFKTQENQEILFDGMIGENLAITPKTDLTEENLIHFYAALEIETINENIRNQARWFREEQDALRASIQQLENEFHYTLREAQSDDAMQYFEWVNDPDVRAFSLNTSDIVLKDHIKWFNQKIVDGNTIMLVMENDTEPVGQIRFEVIDGKAFINYSIDSAYRGQGLGTMIIKKGSEYLATNFPQIQVMVGIVKRKNLAGIKALNRNTMLITSSDKDVLTFTKTSGA